MLLWPSRIPPPLFFFLPSLCPLHSPCLSLSALSHPVSGHTCTLTRLRELSCSGSLCGGDQPTAASPAMLWREGAAKRHDVGVSICRPCHLCIKCRPARVGKNPAGCRCRCLASSIWAAPQQITLGNRVKNSNNVNLGSCRARGALHPSHLVGSSDGLPV